MFKKFFILLAVAIIFVLGFDLMLFRNLQNQSVIPKLSNLTHAVFKNIPNPKTTIILTGDIMLGRSVMKTSLFKNDPNYPFEKVSDVLQKADIVFGNLENPIINNCPVSDTGLKFCTDPKMISGLKNSGLDIVNIANNHTKNYGNNGFVQTEEQLIENGIEYVGDENLVIKRINNISFGFLGFDFVSKKPMDSDYKMVTDSKAKVDVLIVMVHWGIEYLPNPTDLQKSIADNLVKSGADLIVGSHPHWVQNVDFVDGKPIFYSLGNFVFDQPWSEETKNGLAIRLTYDEAKLSTIEKLPIYMKNFAQPEWSAAPEIISQ